MEKRIKTRFHDEILHQSMQRYGISEENIRLLDGFESFMYEFERDKKAYILRISHSLRRNEALIQGEVDWINYLAAGGASVAQALLSEQRKLVEAINDNRGGYFLTTAFTKAEGQPPRKVGWTPELFRTYGKALGRVHALSRQYKVSETSWKRPEWDDDIILDIEKNVPESDTVVLEQFQKLIDRLKRLPKNAASYGMIHFDVHPGNFFVDETGHITLFDFDDCCYGWFIYDIAIVLFYMVMDKKNVPAFTQHFMEHFFEGYRKENKLDSAWLQEIPSFLKLREIDMYGIIHRSFDVKNLDDPWCVNFMHNRKERIENDVPYIDFDFTSLQPYLMSH